MSRVAPPIVLKSGERARLAAFGSRGQIVLLAADGLRNQEIAARLEVPAMTVGKWRRAFVARGLDGLRDAPRSGRPRKHDDQEIRQRVEEFLTARPGPLDGQRRWTVRSLAAELELPATAVQSVLASAGVRLQAPWLVAELSGRKLDIVALHVGEQECALLVQAAGAPMPGRSLQGALQRPHPPRQTLRELLEAALRASRGGEFHLVYWASPGLDGWAQTRPRVTLHPMPGREAWTSAAGLLAAILAGRPLPLANFQWRKGTLDRI